MTMTVMMNKRSLHNSRYLYLFLSPNLLSPFHHLELSIAENQVVWLCMHSCPLATNIKSITVYCVIGLFILCYSWTVSFVFFWFTVCLFSSVPFFVSNMPYASYRPHPLRNDLWSVFLPLFPSPNLDTMMILINIITFDLFLFLLCCNLCSLDIYSILTVAIRIYVMCLPTLIVIGVDRSAMLTSSTLAIRSFPGLHAPKHTLSISLYIAMTIASGSVVLHSFHPSVVMLNILCILLEYSSISTSCWRCCFMVAVDLLSSVCGCAVVRLFPSFFPTGMCCFF